MKTLLYRHNHLLAMGLSMLLIMFVSLQILREKLDPHPCAGCVMPLGADSGFSPAQAALQSSLMVSQLATRQVVSAVQVLAHKD